MNYYEHHIGDFAEATAHLTFIEDAAYSRMIRKYYATERPMPADIKAVQRLIGARTKEERDAVQVVLEEFFTLQDDGWHQRRCDADILKYQDGEPEREVKKANEDNRLRKHREERARLFKVITDAGQHAPWNIGMGELRSMVKALQPAEPETEPETKTPEPETQPATAPATPATATQTPDTRHHPPDTSKKSVLSGAAPALLPPPPAYLGEKNEPDIPAKAKVPLDAAWELPTAWGEDAERLGFAPAEILHQSEKFRQYWTAGKGAGTRRGIKGWRQSWSNWLGNAERFRRAA